MSYFDEMVEPRLHQIPRHIEKRMEKEVEIDLFSIPTNSKNIPWRGNDGIKMKIGDMTDRHLINAHNLLGRRMGMENQKPADHVFYGFLRAEINRRGI